MTASRSSETVHSTPRVALRSVPDWIWVCLVAGVAAIPFLEGLSASRIFYIRDLSLSFWGRYLWLRRTIWSGEWPFWDPYVGAGQSAAADALHQMFLLPVLAVRLIGNEVVGFNLWVALPFPIAAIGAWLFFARRFPAPASALGAIAFAVSGPIVATGNFPNMSWSVAAMPWMLWAVDRLAAAPSPRRLAVTAIAVAFQALAGEPVTLFATFILSATFAVAVSVPAGDGMARRRFRHGAWVAIGLMLGLALAAIQLVPMALAAALAERQHATLKDFWSLHPLGLLETVAPSLFGNYYTSQSLAGVPWMPLLNGGREPFFYSVYFGVPLLALSLFGLGAGRLRAWSVFWTVAGIAALVAAFGGHTPVYPFLREHLPVLGWFRFPVKYLAIFSMVVACGAAAGWDALTGSRQLDSHIRRRARTAAIGFALSVGLIAYMVAGACIYFATPTAFRFYSIAKDLAAPDPVEAAAFMLKALPRLATSLMLLSLGTAVLLYLAAGVRKEARAAGGLLYALIVIDLVFRAWGINPAFDAAHLAEPEWLARAKVHSDARFYVGGKRDGTLDAMDPDSSRAFLNPPGLVGSASRAALNGQAAFYPSAWHGREMLSYDLPVLWPRAFHLATARFVDADAAARDRFLRRAGVRYRVLPERLAAGHTPLVAVPYFLRSQLYELSDGVTSRASVVTNTRVVPELERQLDGLFEDGWDGRTTALIECDVPAAGEPGAPVTAYAKLPTGTSTRVVVEAGAGSEGGYLILLDSYSEDWRVSVDGRPAEMTRANGLFRAVHLVPGTHTIEFAYRPRALQWGAGLSAVAFLVLSIAVVNPLGSAEPTFSGNHR